MQFNIYRDGLTFALTDGDSTITGLVSEGAASDLAVEIAQERGALYTIEYWRP